MRRALALLLAPLLLGATAAKPVLVPDVSRRDIQIAYSFTGAELLLFGAILYPGGREPDADHPADVVVVVKGPAQSIVMREKEKVAGIWVNAARTRFRSAPSFYAIASSKPIGQLVDDRTRAIYELGLDSLQLSPASAPRRRNRRASPPDWSTSSAARACITRRRVRWRSPTASSTALPSTFPHACRSAASPPRLS